MKTLNQLIVLISVLFLFASCSYFITQKKVYPTEISQTALKINPPEGKSIIYVMQPFNHRVRENVASKIYIDDKYIGSVGNHSFIYAIVNPGKHQIKVKSLIPFEGTKKEIITEPGEKYFISQARLIGPLPSMGYTLFEEKDYSRGEQELSKCDLSEDCIFANTLK